MRRGLKALFPVLALSLTLAACGGSSYGGGSSSSSKSASSSSQAGGSGAALVRAASNATLGATVLTNAQGMTLYSLSVEQAGRFICTTAACTQLWHPLSAPGAGAPSGVASLATVARPDGTRQVTYRGMPLYTFAQDSKPGDAKGQGFKDVGTWGAVTVAAATATPATGGAATQSTPTQSSGRHGY